MKFEKIYFEDIAVKAGISIFESETGSKECHAMIELANIYSNVSEQFQRLDEAVGKLLQTSTLNGFNLVWKRYFLSDAANQASYISASGSEAVSVIQQPPMNGSKAALWLYFVENALITAGNNREVIMKRPAYTHLYRAQLHEKAGDVVHQTNRIFEDYHQSLLKLGCNLKDHCIRTWIYVQDVDIQYMGMVDARKIHFEKAGMTPETHYIASTGIEGRYVHPEVLVTMDAYAVGGIREEQVKFLHAPAYLNPTHEYGVTFERGTSVDYGDRRHVFISGTASIDNKGEIVHPLDIGLQLQRTLLNIRMLLAEASATIDDASSMIVYLRDTGDYHVVKEYLEEHLPDTPRIITLAPVCRPGWLIEIECIAIKAVNNKQFAAF